MTTPNDAFPLRRHNDEVLRNLGTELWNWQLCQACVHKPKCNSESCPWNKKEALSFFWRSYESIANRYYAQAPEAAVLSSHDDLLAIIKAIKAHPDWTRAELTMHRFSNSHARPNKILVEMDQTRAVNMAASVVFLIDCGYKNSYTDEVAPFRWRHNVKVGDLIEKVFPPSSLSPMADSKDAPFEQDSRTVFSAANLKKRIAGLHFETTEDLRCHLHFDRRTRVLQVFQATAVLKQILLASQQDPNACAIPRPLAIEVCDTIYNVLFHINDIASQEILEDLIRKNGFDRDLLWYDQACHQLDTENDGEFPYFARRLNLLLKEMEDPSPATWFERLFDSGEKSAERRMLMATMIGVFITAISSMLSLVVASYQAWIGYQQWQSQTKNE